MRGSARSILPVVALPVLSLTVATPAYAAATYTCAGHVATVVGTVGDDVITGTSRADVIVARAGNDRISGGGGNDIICGGYGYDLLLGGSGNDRLYGGPGRFFVDTSEDFTEIVEDTLRGGPGDDVIFPGYDERVADDHHRDRILWDTAPQAVRVHIDTGRATGQGDDRFGTKWITVVGSRYGDHIYGTTRADDIVPGRGNDTVYTREGDDVITETDGSAGTTGDDDLYYGGAGDDVFVTRAGRDRAYGGAGIDYFNDGGATVDTLVGGPDRDIFDADITSGAGQIIDGGLGYDFVRINRSWVNDPNGAYRAVLNMGTGSLRITADASFLVSAPGLENWDTLPVNGDWTVTGSDRSEYFWGAAHLHFRGMGGDDVATGGTGPGDYFDGGDGNDTSNGLIDTSISVENEEQCLTT
jgi:Ca2+-binding RTX toxin-like protein